MAQTDIKQAQASTPVQTSTGASGDSLAELQFLRDIAEMPYHEQVQALTPAAPVQYMASSSAVPAVVQTSGGTAGTTAIKQAAAGGIQGGGGALPHLDRIQQSFGAHDVSSVTAHTGSSATKANQSMGALAYASGNHVAFKSTPDLHTAAHEAAHVIQQRGGVSLSGGVGKVGDAYEKHADSVANAVVSGRSAAPLLDKMGPTQQKADPSVQHRSIQMEGEGGPSTPAPEPAAPSGPPSGATLEERLRDLMGVSTPAIEAGTGDPATTIGPSGTTLEGMVSDSPNPMTLKGGIVALTTAYLALDATTDPAIRQAKLGEIKTKFEELRLAMKHARGEDDKLVAMRVKFEKFVGTKAEGEWPQGMTCVDTMVATAKQMVLAEQGVAVTDASAVDTQLKALPNDFKKTMGETIGTLTNTGFAGVVGQSFDTIVDTLSNGTLVQKAQGLINFAEFYLVPGLLNGSAQILATVRANLAEAAPTIDLQALIDEANATPKKGDRKKILFSSPEFRAKCGGMDTKIMELPVELLNDRQLDFVAQQASPAVDLSGCTTPEAKIAALKAKGVKTSKAAGGMVDATSITAAEVEEDEAFNKQMKGITVDNKSYIEGKLENIVNPEHPWIINANEAQMPLKAGISGTTARFVGAANMLGGDINGAVVAMIGHLQKIEAHSFWEIVEGAGLGMTAGSYVPFPPNDAGMIQAGAQFIDNAENGFADLGAGDKLKARKVLLGEP